MGHVEESAQERGAATHLVGLAGAPDQATDLLAVLAQRIAKKRPSRRGIAVAADRGIVRLQLGQATLEDHPLHHPPLLLIVTHPPRPPRPPPAGYGGARSRFQDRGVERRAKFSAPLCL